MKDAAIFVPSYRRSERIMENMSTLDFLSDEWKSKTYLVVREEEENLYKRVAGCYGIGLRTIPKAETSAGFFGWGHTMDWIVDTFTEEFERIVTMDDDLKLAYRKDMQRGYEAQKPEHFNAMLARLLETDRAIPLMSVTARQFSQKRTEEYRDNARISQLFSFYSPVFCSRPDLRFSRTSGMKFMTDYFFTLNTLSHGIRNRSWNRFTVDDMPDAEGGCSTFRTIEEHSAAAIELSRRFPSLVSLYEKTNWGDNRIGVRVKWLQAYQERREE